MQNDWDSEITVGLLSYRQLARHGLPRSTDDLKDKMQSKTNI